MNVMRAKSKLTIPIIICLLAPFTSLGQFAENSSNAGIDHMCRSIGLMGGGVAVFDFNNDGWEDIYLTGGQDPDQLYRNNGDGTFTALPNNGGLFQGALNYTMGITTGDIDNDGFRDLLLTTYLDQPSILLRNNGNETFTYLPNALPQNTDWSLAASFGDVNNDGLLDIYVTNYVEENHFIFGQGQVVGFAHECFDNLLYINNGNLTFTESTTQYVANDIGCALATAFSDFDNDRDLDLFVINDFGAWVEPNTILENQHPIAAFVNAGDNLNANQGMHGMGIAIGDYDRDADLDYYVTDIGSNLLLRNDGNIFTDVTFESGVENDSIGGFNTVGWGAFITDYDNDGWPDLYVANGNISLPPFIMGSDINSDRLYRNEGDLTFSDVTDVNGLGGVTHSRGAAHGDFDNDGLMDFVVCHTAASEGEEQSKLYINQTDNSGNWLKVKLEGTVSNRDAFGSHVIVVSNGFRTIAEVDGGSSHASQNSSILHFGLGQFTSADSVIVHFTSGTTQVYTEVAANQMLSIVETPVITDINEELLRILHQTSETITYSIPKQSGIASWKYMDAAGRIISQGSAPIRDRQLSLPSWHNQIAEPGLYILQIEIDASSFGKKIIVLQ
jgi:hypothetical protein